MDGKIQTVKVRNRKTVEIERQRDRREK